MEAGTRNLPQRTQRAQRRRVVVGYGFRTEEWTEVLGSGHMQGCWGLQGCNRRPEAASHIAGRQDRGFDRCFWGVGNVQRRCHSGEWRAQEIAVRRPPPTLEEGRTEDSTEVFGIYHKERRERKEGKWWLVWTEDLTEVLGSGKCRAVGGNSPIAARRAPPTLGAARLQSPSGGRLPHCRKAGPRNGPRFWGEATSNAGATQASGVPRRSPSGGRLPRWSCKAAIAVRRPPPTLPGPLGRVACPGDRRPEAASHIAGATQASGVPRRSPSGGRLPHCRKAGPRNGPMFWGSTTKSAESAKKESVVVVGLDRGMDRCFGEWQRPTPVPLRRVACPGDRRPEAASHVGGCKVQSGRMRFQARW